VADSTLALEDIDMPDVAALNYFTDKPVLLTTASKRENGLDDFGASDDDHIDLSRCHYRFGYGDGLSWH
jgi:hypothetical protein